MNSKFIRSLIGFVVLIGAITTIVIMALWSIETYAPGTWLASLIVVMVALFIVVQIYEDTLQSSVLDWIKGPVVVALPPVPRDNVNAGRADTFDAIRADVLDAHGDMAHNRAANLREHEKVARERDPVRRSIN